MFAFNRYLDVYRKKKQKLFMMKELSPASTFPILNSYFPTASIKLCGQRNIDNRLTFHLYCCYLFKALHLQKYLQQPYFLNWHTYGQVFEWRCSFKTYQSIIDWAATYKEIHIDLIVIDGAGFVSICIVNGKRFKVLRTFRVDFILQGLSNVTNLRDLLS